MSKSTKKHIDFAIEIGTNEPKKWSKEELQKIKSQAKTNAQQRSKAQKIKNELMTLQYKIEEYLADDTTISPKLTLEKVIADYLGVLDLSFRKFAIYLDTSDGNLKKYIIGDRKLNPDLALKFGYFFHTSPEIWLRLQLKNELLELKKEKGFLKQYEKYDYTKFLEVA